jgi:hypothetical protein
MARTSAAQALRSGRLPAWTVSGSRVASVFAGTHDDSRVAGVTSASQAINKLNAYVIAVSPQHDLSTEAWKAVWIANFGFAPDGTLAQVNRDGVYTLLDNIDACADDPTNKPGKEADCNEAVDMVFAGLNRDLGLAGDNGWIKFEQLMQWLGRFPINPEDKPGKTADPSVIDDTADPSVIDDTDRMFAALTDAQIASNCVAIASATHSSEENCRAQLTKSRADAKAKIDRLGITGSTFMVSPDIAPRKPIDVRVSPEIAPPKPRDANLPSPETRAAEAFVIPTALGAIAAFRWGWSAFAVGGVVGVVAAAGAYVWTSRLGTVPSNR